MKQPVWLDVLEIHNSVSGEVSFFNDMRIPRFSTRVSQTRRTHVQTDAAHILSLFNAEKRHSDVSNNTRSKNEMFVLLRENIYLNRCLCANILNKKETSLSWKTCIISIYIIDSVNNLLFQDIRSS
jgi:hypothetical protein